uniref:Sodium channel regulatory subunit beta-4 n=1 Tax=Castor canadensis TaxID=51338 RepID=A0A8C0WWX8_CASCN
HKPWMGWANTTAQWPGGHAPYTGLFLLPMSLSLEVSVGKATTIYAVNGTAILLPCTFSSCFGFENLHFWWSYNSSDMSKTLIDGIVKNEKVDPKVRLKDDDRITLEGTTREKMNNISIQLSNLDFSDTGKYTCHVKNPKERAEHNATVFLQVVDKLEEVDNTVTLIILAVVGGVIGLLIFVLLLKKFITFIIKKTQEKKNGFPGSPRISSGIKTDI